MKIEQLCTIVFNNICGKETTKEIYRDVSEFLNKSGFLIIEGEDSINRNIRVYKEVKEVNTHIDNNEYDGCLRVIQPMDHDDLI